MPYIGHKCIMNHINGCMCSSLRIDGPIYFAGMLRFYGFVQGHKRTRIIPCLSTALLPGLLVKLQKVLPGHGGIDRTQFFRFMDFSVNGFLHLMP